MLRRTDDIIKPTYYLGALGMPGQVRSNFLAPSVLAFSDCLLTARLAPQTAYWGLHDVGKIEPGETVVVSGAAGAVGSIVSCEFAAGTPDKAPSADRTLHP